MGGRGRAQQKRSLAEVVEQQRRRHEREPVDLNRQLAEVAEVRVQGFPSGGHQEDGAENQVAADAVGGEEADRVQRTDRRQHRRLAYDAGDAEASQGREPQQDHRAEHRPHARRAAALKEKEREEDAHRDGHDERPEDGCRDLQPLDGTENGDRRRESAVSVQERGTEKPERQQDRAPPAFRGAGMDESHQGEDSALAAVVRAQDVDVVLERDHDDQRPEDQRENAENVLGVDGHRVRTEEALANRIQRTGPDVAVDDADGGQTERRDGGPVAVVPVGRRSAAGALSSRRGRVRAVGRRAPDSLVVRAPHLVAA